MLKKSKKVILSLVAIAALSTSSFAQEEKIYATADGIKITQNDVAALLQGQKVDFESLQKEQQKQILDSLIEQKLLANMAYKTDIPKTQEYKKELENLKKNLAFQFWIRDLNKQITVSDQEAKKFYDENKNIFVTPAQFKANHILVKTQNEAEEIIKQLLQSKNLKEDFIQLAKEKSTGPSAPNGGDLGWFNKDQMVPEFSSATQTLQKGTITKTPVKTNFGYHVIYLDDLKESQTIQYEAIKNQLKQDLIQQQFAQKAKEEAVKLFKKAKIEYK